MSSRSPGSRATLDRQGLCVEHLSLLCSSSYCDGVLAVGQRPAVHTAYSCLPTSSLQSPRVYTDDDTTSSARGDLPDSTSPDSSGHMLCPSTPGSPADSAVGSRQSTSASAQNVLYLGDMHQPLLHATPARLGQEAARHQRRGADDTVSAATTLTTQAQVGGIHPNSADYTAVMSMKTPTESYCMMKAYLSKMKT